MDNTVQDILNDIIYLNYRYNRERSPEIPYQNWKRIYGDVVDKFEVWFQADKIIGSSGVVS